MVAVSGVYVGEVQDRFTIKEKMSVIRFLFKEKSHRVHAVDTAKARGCAGAGDALRRVLRSHWWKTV